LNLWNILKSPDKKFCPWAKDARETTRKADDHSLITKPKIRSREEAKTY